MMKTRPTSITPEVQPVQDDDRWWMLRHQEKVKEVQRRLDRIELLMIGDSITQQWEETSEARALWHSYYASRNALNLGFSGDRTEQVLWRLQNGEIDGLQPRLIVLLIGTNNTGHRQDPPQDTALGIRAILDELNSRTPASAILLLAILPRSKSPNDELRLLNNEINQIISGFSDGQSVHFLDIGHEFVDETGQLNTDLMPDQLHLSPDGYKTWAESMEHRLNELMS